MPAPPEICVVIPTFRRETRLAFALDALARQSVGLERFEVVVVRVDGSRGPLTAPPPGLEVRFLESPGPNASTQRNIGWRSSEASLIAFTDDDCRPSPTWLQSLLDASREDAFVQGRTEPDPQEFHLLGGQARSQSITGPSDWHETCNIAYPRSLLERLGGFDESYPFGCEDTDLGLRALAAGATRIFTSEALVWHAVHLPPLHRALATAGPAPSQPLVLRRHPQQRRALYMRLFWRPAHARLSLTLLGLVLLGRHPRAALALLPYFGGDVRAAVARRELTPRSLVRLALDLALRTLLDSAELVRSARWGAHYKTFVL